MELSKAIELVFEQWEVYIKSSNTKRGKQFVRPHFEELFEKWKNTGASFEELYPEWLPKAIKVHQPPSAVARSTYKILKQKLTKFDKTEKEYIQEWNDNIKNEATEVFFDFFPPPKFDEDSEPKVYGKMSVSEYRAQQKYVNQFPILDTTQLEKQWQQRQYNIDLDDVMKNVLGDKKDETNS